jgi:hypothetical protein
MKGLNKEKKLSRRMEGEGNMISFMGSFDANTGG